MESTESFDAEETIHLSIYNSLSLSLFKLMEGTFFSEVVFRQKVFIDNCSHLQVLQYYQRFIFRRFAYVFLAFWYNLIIKSQRCP